MSKSLVSDIQAAFAPKPRSQQLLEEAAVAVKDEALCTAAALINVACGNVLRALDKDRVPFSTKKTVEKLFGELLSDVEGL